MHHFVCVFYLVKKINVNKLSKKTLNKNLNINKTLKIDKKNIKNIVKIPYFLEIYEKKCEY